MTGTLYIVATPIGNLEDMTYRAVRVLGEVAVIACEDTRQTRKLLEHFGIRTPAVSYHEHNEASRTVELCARLESGEDVALVSDAGTPLVSDPGFRLVREAAARGLSVVPLPGASAAIAALSASGLPPDTFTFRGFPPRKPGERARFFASLRLVEGTVILYEAPHRILDSLDEVAHALGDPPIVAAREISKMHEEFLRGRASEVKAVLSSRDSIRGEFTLVIGPAVKRGEAQDEPIEDAVARLEKDGLSRMEAIKSVARDRGVPKRTVYDTVEQRGKKT